MLLVFDPFGLANFIITKPIVGLSPALCEILNLAQSTNSVKNQVLATPNNPDHG